jgi:hypothetical protein
LIGHVPVSLSEIQRLAEQDERDLHHRSDDHGDHQADREELADVGDAVDGLVRKVVMSCLSLSLLVKNR